MAQIPASVEARVNELLQQSAQVTKLVKTVDEIPAAPSTERAVNKHAAGPGSSGCPPTKPGRGGDQQCRRARPLAVRDGSGVPQSRVTRSCHRSGQ